MGKFRKEGERKWQELCQEPNIWNMESNNHDKSVFSKMVETKTVWIETEIIGGKKVESRSFSIKRKKEIGWS